MGRYEKLELRGASLLQTMETHPAEGMGAWFYAPVVYGRYFGIISWL